MGLVHRHLGNLLLLHQRQKPLLEQPLRGDVNQFVHPLPNLPANRLECLGIQGTVQESRGNPHAVEGRHLILHQGYQR